MSFLKKAKSYMQRHINEIKKGNYNSMKYFGPISSEEDEEEYEGYHKMIRYYTNIQKQIRSAKNFSTLKKLCEYIDDGRWLCDQVDSVLMEFKEHMYRKHGMFKEEVELVNYYRLKSKST